MRSFLVLVSPSAGNTDAESTERALAVLRDAGKVDTETTATPAELDDALSRRGDRTLVVAGGDGSIHAVVNALARRDELDQGTLGLLPLGTGNDFAHGLGLPEDAAEAAQVILTGTPQALDLLLDEDSGSVVVNSVHAGAGAEAARTGQGWKERWGKVGYALGAAVAIVSPPEVRLQVEADGAVVCTAQDRVLQVAIGNGPYVGGGAPLTPDARPDDGQADVLVAAARRLGARLLYAAGLLVGRHGERDDVTTLRARHVVLTGAKFWCSEDGEITGPHRRRAWRVLPGAFRVLVPAPTED
jgi:YegS/Rv2252/BmrU family lipid kinase